MKAGQDVCLDDAKMGHVGSKTRSPGQILGKPCVCTRGHIFSRILMKVGQDVCLMISRTSLKMGHVWVTWGQKLGHQVKS